MTSRLSSRPLRALTLVLCAWTGARLLALNAQRDSASAGPIIAQAVALPRPAAGRGAAVTVPIGPPTGPEIAALAPPASIGKRLVIALDVSRADASGALPAARLVLALDEPQALATVLGTASGNLPLARIMPAATPPEANRKRVSGSSWALLRSGGSVPLGGSGSLGGAQAGVRLFVEPGPRGVALTGRLSAPLRDSKGREASVGVGLRTRGAGVLVERRVALGSGGRNAFSLTGYAGLWDVALPARLRLDGYAQAGFVGLKSRDGFADGALELARDVARGETWRVALGLGLWGGAQPRLTRLDAGPQVSARLRLGPVGMRATASYRVRIAGNARPGSGPALSIGTDF